MAAAFSVNPEPPPPVWALAGEGDFADEVAAALGSSAGTISRVPIADDCPAQYFAPAGNLVRVVCGPAHDALDAIDATAHAQGRMWLPVILDVDLLQVGPLVVPAVSACYACSVRRRIQHANNPYAMSRTLAVPSDASAVDSGWLPWHGAIAGALVGAALRSIDQASGRVWSVNPDSLELTVSVVVGCHGCARCSRGDLSPAGTQRLASAIRALPEIGARR